MTGVPQSDLAPFPHATPIPLLCLIRCSVFCFQSCLLAWFAVCFLLPALFTAVLPMPVMPPVPEVGQPWFKVLKETNLGCNYIVV